MAVDAGVEEVEAAASFEDDSAPAMRDVLQDAVVTLSGAKPGNGIGALLDPSLDTYWQSDGTAPHLISVYFSRKTAIAQVSLYVDFRHDEVCVGEAGGRGV